MSLWDVVKGVGNYAVKTMQDKQEKVLKYKDKYEMYDDEQLFKMYKTTTGDAKLACAWILRERGYGPKSDE